MATRILCLLILCASAVCHAHAQTNQHNSEYLGRYTDGAEYVVYFEQTPYGLTLRPALWTATQLLKQTGEDQFTVTDRASRGATFHRDQRGAVVGVSIRGMEGEGLTLTRASQQLPIEMLLAGDGQNAARAYLTQGGNDAASRILTAAERVLARFPTKASNVVAFLSTAAQSFARDANLHTQLAYAQVASGDRKSALASFRRAYTLDPTNRNAVSGLALLQALPAPDAAKDTPWKLPFPLAAVFAPPTAGEIRAVEADWQSRDLSVRGVEEVTTGRIKFEADEFTVRIVSHQVHGQRHYGAIISPMNAKPSCCPVIVEAKGVSWNYFPLDLERIDSPAFMGDMRGRFIYVLPSFRGEVLHFNGVDYRSEGDRTDAWDGATDDAIAFLNVALKTTAAADQKRICAFGRSRGGTVALLIGERDRRIKCVVEWSGPSDWFELMGTEGWTQQELFQEGLRMRAKPDQTGGQLDEHFLLKAVRGEEDLRSVRHRMLAASPLYFANHLPLVQLHHGVEDPFVPVRNGRQLAMRLKLPDSTQIRQPHNNGLLPRSEAFFYLGQGHDTDRLVAPDRSRKFLSSILLAN